MEKNYDDFIENLRKELDATEDEIELHLEASGYVARVHYVSKKNGKYHYTYHLSTESGVEEDLEEELFNTFEELIEYLKDVQKYVANNED